MWNHGREIPALDVIVTMHGEIPSAFVIQAIIHNQTNSLLLYSSHVLDILTLLVEALLTMVPTVLDFDSHSLSNVFFIAIYWTQSCKQTLQKI